jgi:hypothetical protein
VDVTHRAVGTAGAEETPSLWLGSHQLGHVWTTPSSQRDDDDDDDDNLVNQPEAEAACVRACQQVVAVSGSSDTSASFKHRIEEVHKIEWKTSKKHNKAHKLSVGASPDGQG